MTANVHALTVLGKGDVARATRPSVSKVDRANGTGGLVLALQDVKAGPKGWFETK